VDNKKIGEYLLEKRKEKGITQAQLADQMGVTYQAVSRWEKGDSIPDIEILSNLADYYSVTIDEILQKELVLTPKKETNYMIFIYAAFVFIHILGAGLLIVTVALLSSLTVFDLEESWFIAGIVFLIFAAGGNALLNLYFFTQTKKDEVSLKWYLRSYKTVAWMVLIAVLIIMSYFGGYIILVSVTLLLLVLFDFLMKKKYIHSDLKLLSYGKEFFNNNKVAFIVLVVLFVISILGLPFGTMALTISLGYFLLK